jgi:hypothetical protein
MSAVLGAHSHQKAVCAVAVPLVRLEGPFHDVVFLFRNDTPVREANPAF